MIVYSFCENVFCNMYVCLSECLVLMCDIVVCVSECIERWFVVSVFFE